MTEVFQYACIEFTQVQCQVEKMKVLCYWCLLLLRDTFLNSCFVVRSYYSLHTACLCRKMQEEDIFIVIVTYNIYVNNIADSYCKTFLSILHGLYMQLFSKSSISYTLYVFILYII